MESYKHILLAADFSEHGEAVANRAKDLSEKYQAKLSIVHVMDNLLITDAAYGSTIPFDLSRFNRRVNGGGKKETGQFG